MRKITVLLFLTFMSTGVFAEKVAVMSKVRGEVLLQREDALIYNQTPTVGTVLENNDKIKVDDGFAVMLLLDDLSQFKLREYTEVRLTMVADLSGVAYHVRLDYGQTLTDYTPGAASGFQIYTPTSVISVKGTKFWTISDPDQGDNVIVLEGEVDVTNNITGLTSTAGAGQTIRSTIDGSVQSSPTQEGSIPEDPDDSFGAVEPEQRTPPAGVEVESDRSTTKRTVGIIAFFVVVLGFVLML